MWDSAMNTQVYARCAMLVLALLLSRSSLQASSYKLTGPQEREVERQKTENAKSRKDAEDVESEYVKLANDYYKEKDYLKAIEYYDMALNVTYEEWDIRETTTGGITSSIPGKSKVRKALDTTNTRRARDRLRALRDVIGEERRKQDEQYFSGAFERAEVATMVEDHARAYAVYDEIIAVADRIGQQKHAVQAKIKAQAKQKEVLGLVVKPLDEAEELLNKDKPEEAVEKLKSFERSYQMFLRLSPDIRARYQALQSAPKVQKQNRELEANERIQLGDAAALREDYVSAARYYREALTRHPNTAAAQDASKKLTQMQSDPKIIEAMKLQEIDVKVRPIIMHAETMLRLRNFDDARRDCERILTEFPESSWAKRAREILQGLPQPPAATPSID
jgi:tetratricopeptide (TPR) repeat protein